MARNLVKYSSPDRAAVAQYVDIEAACRAALDGEATGGIVIAGGGGGGGGDGGADTPPGAAGGGGEGASGGSGGGDDGSQGSGDDGGTGGAPAGGDGGDGGSTAGGGDGQGATPPAAPTPSPVLAASLRDTSAEAGGPGIGAPMWFLAVIAALVIAGVGASLIGRTRPRS